MKLHGKYLVLGLMVSSIGFSFTKPNKVKCTLLQGGVATSPFLMHPTLPNLPVVGDVITLDLTKQEIEDLTFESGNAISLKKNKAKLVKVALPKEHDAYMSLYEGKFKSRTGDYTGVLELSHGEKESGGAIEVIRKRFFGGFSLATFPLQCQNVE